MKRTKTISIRVTSEEADYYDQIVKQLGIDRTTLIKNGIQSYVSTLNDVTLKGEAKEIVEDIVSPKESAISHPLLDVVRNEGIQIHNAEGAVIAKITNIRELLDFFVEKVLRDA